MSAIMYNHMSLIQFDETTSKATYKNFIGELATDTMLGLTHEDIQKWIDGMLIQEAMPYLTADQREILLTGLNQDEWDMLFAEEDEDDE